MIADETRTHRAPARTPTCARAHRAWVAGSLGILLPIGATLWAGDALAQDVPQAPSLPEPAGEDDGAPPGDRAQVLEERIAELSARLAKAEEERQKASSPPFSWGGYVDFGFFVPIGNHGVGW